jgi:hypothetical protein
MRVRNRTEADVFVKGYGTVPAGEEATVAKGDGVKEMIKAGTLSEVTSTSDSSGTTTTNDEKGANGDAA